MQLQDAVDELRTQGLGLAAISYDPLETLKAFASARGITYPLLSDSGSATIRRYNILDGQASGQAAGIPHPGTFMVDARGIVVARSFEERYQERASARSLLPPRAGASRESRAPIETAHLVLTLSASDVAAAPGTRVSLLLDVRPKPRMHVYAPGQKDLIPISLSLTADESFKTHPTKLPPAEKYFFEPLEETQLVFSRPFRVTQDVTLALTPALRTRAREAGASLMVSGTLRYQACDDKVCYMPESVPVSWAIGLRPLER